MAHQQKGFLTYFYRNIRMIWCSYVAFIVSCNPSQPDGSVDRKSRVEEKKFHELPHAASISIGEEDDDLDGGEVRWMPLRIDAQGLPYIMVAFENGTEAEFLLDTGLPLTFVSSRIFDYTSLSQDRDSMNWNFNNFREKFTLPCYRISNMAIGPFKFEHVPVYKSPDDDDDEFGDEIGTIGISLFSQCTISIDFIRSRFSMSSNSSSDSRSDGWHRLNFDAWLPEFELELTPAGDFTPIHKTNAFVDTGGSFRGDPQGPKIIVFGGDLPPSMERYLKKTQWKGTMTSFGSEASNLPILSSNLVSSYVGVVDANPTILVLPGTSGDPPLAVLPARNFQDREIRIDVGRQLIRINSE